MIALELLRSPCTPLFGELPSLCCPRPHPHSKTSIVALGQSPSKKNQWLNSETLSLFRFHEVAAASASEQVQLLQKLFPALDSGVVQRLCTFAERCVRSVNPTAHASDPPPELRWAHSLCASSFTSANASPRIRRTFTMRWSGLAWHALCPASSGSSLQMALSDSWIWPARARVSRSLHRRCKEG